MYCNVSFASPLKKIDDDLCHPGITRLLHYIRSKNMPLSSEELKEACSSYKICAELKPRFASSLKFNLIKATQPLEGLSMNFKGPLLSSTSKKYLFVATDELSTFLLAIPCKDTSSKTVIQCRQLILSLCRAPSYIHSERGFEFMARDVKEYLLLPRDGFWQDNPLSSSKQW